MALSNQNQSSMATPAVPPQSHISDAIRAALPKLGAEKSGRVLAVADRDRK